MGNAEIFVYICLYSHVAIGSYMALTFLAYHDGAGSQNGTMFQNNTIIIRLYTMLRTLNFFNLIKKCIIHKNEWKNK